MEDLKNERSEQDTAIEEREKAPPKKRSKRVLIGMTGGIDSTVAAFLLKKQGWECAGLGMVLLNKEETRKNIKMIYQQEREKKGVSFADAKEKRDFLDKIDQSLNFLNYHCTVDKMDEVKEICDKLDIPFYGVKIFGEYEDAVIDMLVAAKVMGKTFSTCVQCNQLKISVLHQKTQQLGMDWMATGHYAKIYYNSSKKIYQMYASNDVQNDQSYMLSGLPQKFLQNLVFPLGDLRKEDVKNISQNFNLYREPHRDPRKMCFLDYGPIGKFVESRAHSSFLTTGYFINQEDKLQLYEHKGIHYYRVGQTDLEAMNPTTKVEKHFYVVSIHSNGKIFVGTEDDITYDALGAEDVTMEDGTDYSRPLRIYVQTSPDGAKHAARLYLKNNNYAKVDFDKPMMELRPGAVVAFYNHPNTGARVIGRGRISFLGDMSLINRTESVDSTPDRDDEGNKIQKVRELSF